jgi:acetyl-CoA carboxylase biotin carboxyl carrier protein
MNSRWTLSPVSSADRGGPLKKVFMNDTPDTPDERSSSSHSSNSSDTIDTRYVRRLADILKATDLTSIEVERGGLRIRVAREIGVVAAPMAGAVAAPMAAAPAAAPVSPMAASAAPAPPVRTGELVKSPMVGTAYLQPQPGSPAFIKVGDQVSEGQTLILIEAMKTMNPIAAPRAGVVAEILVGDAQPVEFGQPLVVLE